MNIALCYPHVWPERGGAETYIADLSRRLVRDGHQVHLYARDWDTTALPSTIHFHSIITRQGPRFLRPWRFSEACERERAKSRHDVSIGFDKTWGQDILYPQGGLHTASAAHNRLKFPSRFTRWAADLGKWIDPSSWSYARLERKQYLNGFGSLVVVNSEMVRQHFEDYLGFDANRLRVIHSAIDPDRFHADDRPTRRATTRDAWQIPDGTTVGLFVAMNYRLKGLWPLLHGLAAVPRDRALTLAIVGHPRTGRYERLAAQLGVSDRVRFIGFRRDPKEAYFAADFLVHPTFYDPCSLVALEALACGLPVITSRYNGASELLTPPTDGLVIADPHNASELGTAMASMCDPNVLRDRTTTARRTGHRWTFEEHYRTLTDLFREVAEKKQAA